MWGRDPDSFQNETVNSDFSGFLYNYSDLAPFLLLFFFFFFKPKVIFSVFLNTPPDAGDIKRWCLLHRTCNRRSLSRISPNPKQTPVSELRRGQKPAITPTPTPIPTSLPCPSVCKREGIRHPRPYLQVQSTGVCSIIRAGHLIGFWHCG